MSDARCKVCTYIALPGRVSTSTGDIPTCWNTLRRALILCFGYAMRENEWSRIIVYISIIVDVETMSLDLVTK